MQWKTWKLLEVCQLFSVHSSMPNCSTPTASQVSSTSSIFYPLSLPLPSFFIPPFIPIIPLYLSLFAIVTGKTLKENLADVKPLDFTQQKVIYPVSKPIAPPMHRIFNFLLLSIRFVLFCFVLFCFVLFCFVLFCFVLFCFVLFCFVLFCFVLFCMYYLVLVFL